MTTEFITLFGATGSIGDSALDIIASHPERYQVYAISAFSRVEKLAVLAKQFRVKVVVLPDLAAKQEFTRYFTGAVLPEIRFGQAGLIETAEDPMSGTIVCAVVGAAGLPSAYAAVRAGKKILLANKEALVSAGPIFMQAVAQSGARLLPIDSEHNAIFQCLPADQSTQYVEKLILTASGGPFRLFSSEQLASVTPEQACKHPNWSMGKKISVDSATMLNKGLEVIEAKYLFDVAVDKIEVLVHPQSTIHSLVQYVDGSLLAQLGHADMRIPISLALAYPERIAHQAAQFDLSSLSRLDFEAPDVHRFPLLGLAYQALRDSLASCIVLNAANEIAVQAFLDRQIGFQQIASCVADMLNRIPSKNISCIDEVLDYNHQVRLQTQQHLTQ